MPLEGGRVRNLYHKYGRKERENNVGNLRRERRCLARRSKRVRTECKTAEIKDKNKFIKKCKLLENKKKE